MEKKMRINFWSSKKEKPIEEYNLQDYTPIIKCSICNGEQVAGFKEKSTGHFTEIMLIRNRGDLEVFKQKYGIEEVKKEY